MAVKYIHAKVSIMIYSRCEIKNKTFPQITDTGVHVQNKSALLQHSVFVQAGTETSSMYLLSCVNIRDRNKLTCLLRETISLSIAFNIWSPWLAGAGAGGPAAIATKSSWLMYIPRGGLRLWRRRTWQCLSRFTGPVVGRTLPVRLQGAIRPNSAMYLALRSWLRLNMFNLT